MCPLPSYKLQPREAITVTSEALVLRVLKYAFLIAEFVTQLQLLPHENTPLSPAAWSAPLCYIYPGRLKAFCQPSPLRKHTLGGLCKRGKAPTKSQYEVRKSGFLFSVRPVSAQIPPEGEKKRFCCSTRITELSFGSNVKHCCRVSEKIGADFQCVKAQSAPRALLSADRATQQQRFNPPPVCQVRLD